MIGRTLFASRDGNAPDQCRVVGNRRTIAAERIYAAATDPLRATAQRTDTDKLARGVHCLERPSTAVPAARPRSDVVLTRVAPGSLTACARMSKLAGAGASRRGDPS